MRILALFIFLITTAEASDLPNIKNIVIHKVPKTYENVFFLNKKNEKIKKEKSEYIERVGENA